MRRKLYYEKPKIKVIQLEEEDIIRTSPGSGVGEDDEWTGFY